MCQHLHCWSGAWYLLDIIHCLCTACAMALCQFLDCGRVEYLLGHLINFLPDLTQCTTGRERAKVRVGETFHRRHVAFECLHDLRHGDLGRWFGEHVPAFG